ncbi:MAG: pyridoxal phosphate-dependent aminotransferase [Phycisphaerae bacterium]|nr:pyridoxal phosphate-dependent aminotransferase [Phycisphaerae bacterium]
MSQQEDPIFLSPPLIGGEEKRYVKEAFDTNWIAPVGPNIDHFEQELALKVGVDHACALSSGTAAIHLGLQLLGVGPGDLVICSSLTFVASANPIRYCGAEPVFVDSDPATWCMSVPALRKTLDRLALEGRTPKACVAVSLYGQCAPMPEIVELCRQNGVKVLDEAAEALGARHGSKLAGSFGDLGVYSFNGNKIITTSGGGALVGNDGELIERGRFLSTQARDPSEIGAYEHHVTGNNYRMSNVLAGIGRGQLRVLEDRIEARRAVFDRYLDGLRTFDGIDWMPEADYGIATRWLSCCLLPNETIRNDLLRRMHKRKIDARPVWKPMHLQPLFARCEYETHSESKDESAQIFNRGLCLPSGSSLSLSDQERVMEVVATTLS